MRTEFRVEVQCAAARRYAQLIFYHDNLPKPQYGHNPVEAWYAFCRQFISHPRATVILSIIGHSFRVEFNRLVKERREGNVQGKSPAPASGRWHQL